MAITSGRPEGDNCKVEAFQKSGLKDNRATILDMDPYSLVPTQNKEKELMVSVLPTIDETKGTTIKRISKAKFHKMAKDVHGLELESKNKVQKSCAMTLEEFMNMKFKKRQFLIEPFLKDGQTIMIKAKRKHFKSWVGYEIAACASSGGSMGGRFYAPKPSIVLLVEAEMPPDELQDRFQSILTLYDNQSLLSKNLKVTSLELINKDLDLTSAKGQDWLEKHRIDANVIVIDNLGKVLPDGALLNIKKWRIFYNWVKKLNKQGTSIVLIHHETKDGKTRGTAKMEDDMDLVVALKKSENQELPDDDIIEFRFEACRYLKGDEKAPFYIRYYEEDGVFKRDIQNIDLESGKPIKVPVPEEEIEKYNLDSDLKIEIFTAAISGKTFRRKYFENGEKGRSSSTIKDRLKEFCDGNILEKNGYEYQLHPDLKETYG